jgi:serine/threonine protein kinase
MGVETLEHCISVRSFTAPAMISDYCVESVPYTNSHLVGIGGSSVVTIEKDPRDCRKYAVKHFSAEVFDKVQYFREIEFLAKLNHPCILRILGWSFPSESAGGTIHTEYAENGSLAFVLRRVQMGSQFDFWNATGKGIIICGIVIGMRFVHSHDIIHRDLKPSNILISESGQTLIGDFGTSRYEWDDATLTTGIGTVNYAAPEQFQNEEDITNKIDVFSFGLILYEILIGSAVFPSSMYPFPIMRRVLNGDMPSIPERCGPFMQRLIHRCWSMNPQSRPSFDDIFVELQSNDFRIFPGADPRVIREYVTGILAWEARYALSKQDTETRQ